MRFVLHHIVLAAGVIASVPCVAQSVGSFEGRVVVEWVTGKNPERDMKILEPFAFIDPAGKRWSVPVGAVVNGASIPQTLWSLAGSPYTGNYRRASVVHDYHCDLRTETWQNVHRMFFDAMIAGGVDEIQGKLYYAAVYAAGPRWHVMVVKNLDGGDRSFIIPQIASIAPPAEQDIRDWIRRENPRLDQIQQRLDKQVVVK